MKFFVQKNQRTTLVEEKQRKKQTVRARVAEGTGGNILKADSKKTLKDTEEKRGDLGNV